MAKEDIFDKQSQIDALNVLEATRNQKTEEYVDRVNSRLSKRTKMTKGEMDMSLGHKRSYDEELPSTSSKKVGIQYITQLLVRKIFISSFHPFMCIQISTYENEEDITQEDTLSSVAEVSDTFGKIKFQHIMTSLSLFGMIETLRRTIILLIWEMRKHLIRFTNF
uniref:Uncharacterized protein n=1 Tax=Rhizophagus irregularis (strain DAOM 181602 / DAOM 197198 / MUCL 43194) TaxID=747089 RepID=U9TXZ7_RHIID